MTQITVFPALPLQRRLWWLSQLNGPDPAYLLAAGLWLDGPLNEAAFERALDLWLERHEGLRTAILPEDGTPRQAVFAEVPRPLERHDLRAEPAPEAAASRALRARCREPLALGRAPLVRLTVFRTGEERALLGIVIDHAIADAVAVKVLSADLAALYAFAAGAGSLPAPPILQPGDIAVWLDEMPHGGADPQAIADRVAEIAPLAPLIPPGRPHGALPDRRVGGVEQSVSAMLASALARRAQMLATTEAAAWLGHWAAVIDEIADVGPGPCAAGRRPAVLLAVPVENRDHPDLAEVAAPLIDTTVVAVERSPRSLPDWVAAGGLALRRALDRQPAPFEQVVAGLGLPRAATEQGPTPLAFSWSEPLVPPEWAGLETTMVAVPAAAAKFDLNLLAERQHNGSILLRLEYAVARYDEKQADAWLGRLLTLAGRAAEDRRATPNPPAGDDLARRVRAEWTSVLPASPARDDSDFFRDGGHSLLVAKLSLRLAEALGRRVPARLVLEHPRLGDLVAALRAGEGSEGTRDAKEASATDADHEPVARPLTDTQTRIWLLDRLQPDSPAYVVTGAVRLDGPFDVDLLRDALDRTVSRHPMLGIRVELRDGRPRQWLFEPLSRVPLPFEDLSKLPPDQRDATLRSRLDRLAATPFEPDARPLLRAAVYRLDHDQHVAALSVHHLAADGTSLALLLRELGTTYAFPKDGRVASLAKVPDPLAWLDRPLDPAARTAAEAFWRENLAAPPHLELPTDRPRSSARGWQAGVHRWRPAPDRVRSLTRLARAEGASPFMAFLSIWALLLARYTEQDDLVLGVPFDLRDTRESEGLIGCLIDTVPVRLSLARAPSGRELLRRVRKSVLEALTHGEIGLQAILEAADAPRHSGDMPLFSTLVAHQAQTPESVLFAGDNARDVRLTPLTVDPPAAQFDLALHLAGDDEAVSATIVWRRSLFRKGTITRMVRHLERLLHGLVEDPDAEVGRLPLTSLAELRRIARWNGTGRDHGTPETMAELLDRQATLTPDACALIDGERLWTHGELHRAVADLARGLAARRLGPGQVVAVSAPRSAELTLALAAVARSGAAFLPIPPDTPAPRVASMLEDARPAAVLMGGDGPFIFGADVPLIDLAGLARTEGRLPSPPAPTDPAYILFTSGSTGRPKGAVVSNRALANRLAWIQEAYPIGPGDRVLQKTPVSFDVALWEFFWPLRTGAAQVVAPPDLHRDPRGLARLIGAKKVTHLHFVPSMLAAFLEAAPADALASVSRVFVSGEALPAALERRFFRANHRASLHNLYGPTEAAIDVTAWDCRPPGGKDPPPIGAPVANTQIHIVDQRGAPMPIGVPGEILIGGVQVADGYVNRPELTAERFAADPFAGRPGARLYRTGDRGRWRIDGVIEYLGRLDGQIKLRGQRIEPGEIEAVLEQHPAVGRAAVVPVDLDRPTARMHAFVVPAGDAAPDPEVIRGHAADRLPQAMVPVSIEFLSALPTTANGKLDRSCLPQPQATRTRARRPIRPGAEQRIADAWAEVLGHANFGPEDAFFDAGGTSLALVAIETRLRAHWPGLELADLFRHPTIAGLAWALSAPATPTAGPREPAAPAAPVGVSEPHVAITALVGRFPGAGDVDSLWARLLAGEVGYRRTSGPVMAPAAGVERVPMVCRPDGTDLFDPEAFGLRPSEAVALDPQIRVLLELAWEALDSAGLDPAALAGRIGVFAGMGLPVYGLTNLFANPDLPFTDPAAAFARLLAADKDYLPGRIAHLLDLRGPALAVQTACSTGLVAVHLAAEAIRRGACEAALAGGATLLLPSDSYPWQQGGIFSRLGKCRPFDAAADGTIPGEGAAMVVLRRLDAALRDGDPVLAVLAGSAIANDGGARAAFTAPSQAGQAATIRAALDQAGLAPASVGYVEAHGTGTALGDLVETTALADVFGTTDQATPDRSGAPSRLLGSIKANLGHLDTAAGTAGLIKATLAVQRGIVPGTPGVQFPAPSLPLSRANFVATAETRPWPAGHARRVAGVSAFGIGGTNAHAVVVEAPPRPAATVSDTATRPHLLPLSAPDAAGLARWAERLAGLAGDGVDLGRLAWTLQAGRRRLPARAALVVGTAAEAAEALAALAAGRSHPARVGAPAPTAPEAGLAFLFPGQGVAAPGLLSGLTEQSAPVAVATVERLLEALDLDTAAELRRLIFEPANPEAARALNRTEFAQPVLFLTGLATARQLEAWGHRAETVVGHSLGDWTSAALAGVIEERRALEAIRVRAAAMGEAAPGSMLSVGAPAADLLASLDGDLSLAADNAPNLSVVAGSEAPLARLEARLKADGIICHRLPVAHAFHSGAMAPAAARLQSELRGLVMAEPDRRYVSSVLGREVCLGDLADPGLWARQLTEPVRFRAAAAALGSPPPLMVEVGPGQTLQTLVTAQRGDAATIGTLPGPADEMPPPRALMRTLGALWLAGRESRWATLQSVVPEKLSLPPYPFDRRRFWHLPKRLRDIARVSDGPERTTPAWHRLPWRSGTTGARVADPAILAEGARAVLEACRPQVGVSARAPALDRRRPLLIPMPVDRAGLPALVDRLIALGRSAFSGRVVLVTCGGLRVLGDEPVDPLAAAVQALSLSAAQELGPLAIHALDLDPEEPARGVDQALVWLSRSSPPRRLALRRGGVWRFGIADAREAGRPRSPLAGHLLLTGGGGRLGQAIACAVAGKARAGGLRLTLIGRRAAAPVGAGCHCLEADVSDRAALAASLERARAEAGPIDYVIHAAGPAAAAAYQPITRGWRPEVASAKWDGLENLLLALAPGEPRRSGLLVSSLATVLGGLGLASYAAANAAAEARALTAGPLWSALALDGLATQGSPGQDNLIALADAANEAERLLAEPTNTITLLAAKSLAPRLDIWVDGLTPPDADREDIALASDPANPIAGADLVRAIEAAFEDLLGHRPESKEADFFALGGDSLLLVRLLPRLTALAGVPLRLADIAARASVSGIVDVIAARRIETAARRTRTDTTPDRIADLTMEEGEL